MEESPSKRSRLDVNDMTSSCPHSIVSIEPESQPLIEPDQDTKGHCRRRSTGHSACRPDPLDRLDSHSLFRRWKDLGRRIFYSSSEFFTTSPSDHIPNHYQFFNHRSNNSNLLRSNSLQMPPKLSARSSLCRKAILIISSLVLIYLVTIYILDQPSQLDLDPIINPATLQILPEGDPTKHAETFTVASAAIDRLKAQEESDMRVRIQHAVHPNITNLDRAIQAEKSLSGTRLPQLIPVAKEEWYTPSQALINNRPCSRFRCDESSKTLIFLGIFTTPASFEKRQLVRTFFKPDLPSHQTTSKKNSFRHNDHDDDHDDHHRHSIIEFKFISGKPENENWKEMIRAENELNDQDIIILEDVEKDNVDLGKSFKFLKWIAEREKVRKMDRTSPEDRDPRSTKYQKPKFVIKADDDTFLVLPNLIKQFKDLDCQENIYWGTSQGSSKLFGSYFRGLGYGLSWPLVEWIGTSNMTKETQSGIEDARVGAWLSDLDPDQDPLKRIDVGWKMGDWNQVEIDEEIIGLHWLKSTEWFPMVKLKVLNAWGKVNQTYRWDWFLNPSSPQDA